MVDRHRILWNAMGLSFGPSRGQATSNTTDHRLAPRLLGGFLKFWLGSDTRSPARLFHLIPPGSLLLRLLEALVSSHWLPGALSERATLGTPSHSEII